MEIARGDTGAESDRQVHALQMRAANYPGVEFNPLSCLFASFRHRCNRFNGALSSIPGLFSTAANSPTHSAHFEDCIASIWLARAAGIGAPVPPGARLIMLHPGHCPT